MTHLARDLGRPKSQARNTRIANVVHHSSLNHIQQVTLLVQGDIYPPGADIIKAQDSCSSARASPVTASVISTTSCGDCQLDTRSFPRSIDCGASYNERTEIAQRARQKG